ncbi:MAG TPA: cation diffusion facilitator family transporter [Candidatus Binataceae bacterium]|nr:cation diffusion facilitator family transporter [Candidatus Binataceae bacterium]
MDSDRARLRWVLIVVTLFLIAEVAGGIYSNSLALLSDAGHVLTDIGAICLSLFTIWISSRPAGSSKTYGYLRAEILGALFNGVFLWLIAVFIFIEAIDRIREPRAVEGLPVMLLAVGGIFINCFAAWMTHSGGPQGRMAVRAVFLHAMTDLAGSCFVLISGSLVYFTGWTRADPVASVLLALLIIYGSWSLVREGVDILMEAVPSHIDLEELRNDLLAIDGTAEVHDLHVWCLTSREYALSAHAVVVGETNHDLVLSEMCQMLERKFNIRHMTIQLERDSRREQEPAHY